MTDRHDHTRVTKEQFEEIGIQPINGLRLPIGVGEYVSVRSVIGTALSLYEENERLRVVYEVAKRVAEDRSYRFHDPKRMPEEVVGGVRLKAHVSPAGTMVDAAILLDLIEAVAALRQSDQQEGE